MTKEKWIAAVVGIVVVALLVLGFGPSIITNNGSETRNLDMGDAQLQNSQPNSGYIKVDNVRDGAGREATAGDVVVVHYTGRFENGQVFDSSVTRGQPFEFTLGAGQVIPGWDIGVAGMKVGSKRMLTIPPELAYGPNDYGPIPGGSTLVFDVELLQIK